MRPPAPFPMTWQEFHLRRLVLWDIIQKARIRPPRPPITLTIQGGSASTNGTFTIDTITVASTTWQTLPFQYRPEEVRFMSREPQEPRRRPTPEEHQRARAKRKAAREARKASKRGRR